MAQERPVPTPWNLPPSLPKKKAKDFHVTCLSPSSVVYNKQDPVVIVFNQSLPSNVEFTIKFVGQQTNNETQCYAQKIGDNVLTFRAPEHYPPEDVILSVYHGKFLTKLCDCTAFSFTSFLQQVRDQLMHVSDPVEFMCAALHLKQKNVVALDFEFEKQFKKNIPPHFDLIADKHPRKIEESSTFDEYPTLLHFAARYNLIKLCIAILKCHGGYNALNIRNKDGFTPSELASEHGHDNLAFVLGDAQQHHNITIEPSDIYESMHDPIYESYVRVIGEASEEEIYVTMDHGNEDDIYEAMVGHGYEDEIYQNSGHFHAAYADTTSLASVSSTSSSESSSSTGSGSTSVRPRMPPPRLHQSCDEAQFREKHPELRGTRSLKERKPRSSSEDQFGPIASRDPHEMTRGSLPAAYRQRDSQPPSTQPPVPSRNPNVNK